MRHILDGVKVLDFTTNVAGPAATAMLADHGASIIKVERPGAGDDLRGYMPKIGGVTVQYWWVNRGKKSVTIALDDPEGVALVKKIAETADVICESFRPGVMKKFGLDYDSVVKLNPNVVYCSVSAFGQTGPYSKKPGYDVIARAMSGIMDLTGPADGAPQKIGVAMGDYVGALNAYGGLMSALVHKFRTGEGQYVDVSLLEGMVGLNSSIEVAAATGKNITRIGNHQTTLCPYGVFNGSGGQSVVIAAPSDKMWASLCAAIGKPELASHPDFNSGTTRVNNLSKVIVILEEWLAAFDDIQQAADLLERVGVPCCKVKTTTELLTDEHLLSRGSMIYLPAPKSVETQGISGVKARGAWIKYSKTPAEFAQAPDLGEHNAYLPQSWGTGTVGPGHSSRVWRAGYQLCHARADP